MKTLLIVISLLSGTALFGQNFSIRGTLNDGGNGDAMAFEKVKLLKQSDSSVVTGATTDVNGFYTIPKVAQGDYIIKIENFAYEVITKNISVTKAEGIEDYNFVLKKLDNVKKLDEVNVSADSKRKKTEVLISQISLDKKGLERIPSVGAENDIVGAFSVTPGVVTTGDQGGQLFVRGGTPIQNKILLDGMTIYTPFHTIGFFSVFETELIKSADIYTGGFDAVYGGRISSIMDITYRDGNRKKWGGKVSASPFMGKAVLEGPLGKRRENGLSAGSLVLSAKHSLLDYTSRSLYKSINDGEGMPFTFTDLYSKITFNGEGGSKFSAFGFHNRDSVNYQVADLDWKSSGGGMNFILVPNSSPIILKGHVNASKYETSFTENVESPRFSSIGGFDLGFDFTYFLAKESELDFGFNFGGFQTNFTTYNEASRKIELNTFSTEFGVYISNKLIINRWVIQPSIRAQYYASANNTISPEPRLGLKYNVNEKFRVKASGGRFSQNLTSASSDKDIVNLFNGMLAAPASVQSKFVTQFNKEREVNSGLQYAWHAIAGFEYDLTDKIGINIEGYYKYFSQLSNINQNKIYEDVFEFVDQPDEFKKDFIIESGQSYGVDFLAKYSSSRLFLWGVYSYGYNTRWDGFQEYFPVFDRRHNVNLVGTYLFGKKKDLELSVRWNLGSGLPFTPTSGFYQAETFSGGVTTDYTTTNPSEVSVDLGEFNSERLPYYHRLDLTLKKKFIFKNSTELEVTGSVTNVYNRNNIFYINRVTQETIYQFPILPSLGMSYKF